MIFRVGQFGEEATVAGPSAGKGDELAVRVYEHSLGLATAEHLFGSLRITVYALILTAVIVYRTEGLIPFLARKYEQFERWVDV